MSRRTYDLKQSAKIICVILFVFWVILVAGCTNNANYKRLIDQDYDNINLQFDGIYRTKSGVSWNNFRFYPDGTVLSLGSSKSPDELKSIMSNENQEFFIYSGKYEINGNELEFYIETPRGNNIYRGGQIDGKLYFYWESRITRQAGRSIYSFLNW